MPSRKGTTDSSPISSRTGSDTILTMKRSELIDTIAERIARITSQRPVRVAIDGVDGVGKTVFADELAGSLIERERTVIRASVDGFHNPRSIRYRLGRNSPEGYFEDSFNYSALKKELLEPLGPGGSLRYRRAVFDYRTDCEITMSLETAAKDSILIFDGVFLHRSELVSYWEMSVFLDAPLEVTIARAAMRDGGSPDINSLENQRYVKGQQLYLRTCEPKHLATIVIDNEVFVSPKIVAVK